MNIKSSLYNFVICFNLEKGRVLKAIKCEKWNFENAIKLQSQNKNSKNSLEIQIVKNDNFYQFLAFSRKIKNFSSKMDLFPTPNKKII